MSFANDFQPQLKNLDSARFPSITTDPTGDGGAPHVGVNMGKSWCRIPPPGQRNRCAKLAPLGVRPDSVYSPGRLRRRGGVNTLNAMRQLLRSLHPRDATYHRALQEKSRARIESMHHVPNNLLYSGRNTFLARLPGSRSCGSASVLREYGDDFGGSFPLVR